MKYNPDTHFTKISTHLFQFFLLNILYLCLCLPIVTIGWATSALLETLMRYSENQGYLLKDFAKALKTNWKSASIIYAILGIPFGMLLFSCFFWFATNDSLSNMFAIAAAFFSCYLYLTMVYAWALIGKFRTTIRQALRNAILLPFVSPLAGMKLLVVPVTSLALCYVSPLAAFLFLLFGFSSSLLVMSTQLNSTFATVADRAASSR